MKHDHDDDEDYSGLLDLMVKFGKKDMTEVISNPGKFITLAEFIRQHDYQKELNAIEDRVVDQVTILISHCRGFWCLMTLLNSDDIQMVVEKFRRYVSSTRAFYKGCNDKYRELMELAGRELLKIKQQFPSQVGKMTTESELQSTIEMFLSFQSGLMSLRFKLRMRIVYFLKGYPHRPEMQNSVNKMREIVVDEVKQYEQEVEKFGSKIKQVLDENLRKKAMKEKKENDVFDDDPKSNDKRKLQVLEYQVKEWMSVVHDEHMNE